MPTSIETPIRLEETSIDLKLRYEDFVQNRRYYDPHFYMDINMPELGYNAEILEYETEIHGIPILIPVGAVMKDYFAQSSLQQYKDGGSSNTLLRNFRRIHAANHVPPNSRPGDAPPEIAKKMLNLYYVLKCQKPDGEALKASEMKELVKQEMQNMKSVPKPNSPIFEPRAVINSLAIDPEELERYYPSFATKIP